MDSKKGNADVRRRSPKQTWPERLDNVPQRPDGKNFSANCPVFRDGLDIHSSDCPRSMDLGDEFIMCRFVSGPATHYLFEDIAWMCGDWLAGQTRPPGWQSVASAGHAGGSVRPWGTAWSAHSADVVAGMSHVLWADAQRRGDATSTSTYSNGYWHHTNWAAKIRAAYCADSVITK